ncbi:DNA alkylation repair protein [Pedobacter sp. AW1-32]|uniref:DNA alkylation repair protein n=1 Tax=Pedobacter sp. AW1-32 TaxID=3383026 RepID=UPI003FF0D70F
MAEPLKNLYSVVFYDKLSNALLEVLPDFDRQRFLAGIFSDEFPQMELKERMRHTTVVLHQFLPEDFSKAIQIIYQTIDVLRQRAIGEDGLAFMFFADYIETYGLNDFETAIEAIEFITQFVSCEFAVRPFLLKYGEQMLAEMLKWSTHANHKVRRLASEGSRPRLPWAMGIPHLKENPEVVLPILENLKNDSSEWVRRSVANNLNDIAKSHPNVVIDTAKRWKNISAETDAIIKHGSRTLLKQGHPEILQYYGLNHHEVGVSNVIIHNPEIRIGDSLEFSFSLANLKNMDQKIRLEYAIYYKKQNGQNTRKVYKISERIYPAGAEIIITRKQKFIPVTTRVFHSGEHHLAITVNGAEKEKHNFDLIF